MYDFFGAACHLQAPSGCAESCFRQTVRGFFFVLAPPSFAFLLHCKGYVALGGHGCLSRLDRKEHSDGLGPDMGQNAHQEAHSEHFGGLAPDMARMGLRRLILRIPCAYAPGFRSVGATHIPVDP